MKFELTLTLPVGPIPESRKEKRGFVRQVLQVIKTIPLTLEEAHIRAKMWKRYYGIGDGSINWRKLT